MQKRLFGWLESVPALPSSGVQSLPCQSVRWAGGLVGHALPPHVAVVGQGDVGEDRVALLDGGHRVGVGRRARAGGDAEEPELRVDGVEAAVLTEAHPGDVVADHLGLPAGDGGRDHREVRLATGGREGRRDVVDGPLGRGELEDEHVLGHPALVAGDRRGDAQRVALLAEQGVAAVAGAVAPDRALLGEVDDVLRVGARPRDVGLALGERRADRVERRHVVGVRLLDLVEHLVAAAGHDEHRDDDVGRVGDLDAEHRDLGLEVTHDERDDVHRAARACCRGTARSSEPSSRRAPSSCWWARSPSRRRSRCRSAPRRARRRWGRRRSRRSSASCSRRAARTCRPRRGGRSARSTPRGSR